MSPPVCFFDSPNEILDCSGTNIPGSGDSPLQVVASLPFTASRLVINDAVGSYVGLYVGPPGQEQLAAIICSGHLYPIPCEIRGGSRISLRSMVAQAISSGSVCVTFMS